jgi:alkylation response protein AidB-like acyl-CoA dehydrogenase
MAPPTTTAIYREKLAEGALDAAPSVVAERVVDMSVARTPEFPPGRQIRGGSFLFEDTATYEMFTPEDLTDDQRVIGETAATWMKKDVLPALSEILKLNYETSRRLMRQGGDLGLLGIEIPEAYGGLGLDKVSATVAFDNIAREASFSVTYMAHTGIGTLPILYFGTEAQKQKYLPKFASGEWIGAYSLSEASSASDALNAKARAVLSPDQKHWILNGEKMWLTNAGIADVYTTFAKVDGQHFTAFIVDKGSPGVSLGPEEKKTGIKGSSTRPLILANAQIPRENVLGEIGQGHKIAFNVLNIGRFKLGVGCTGGSKLAIESVVEYARGRVAFGRPISDFGLIRHKIGEMVIRAYVAESAVYRTAGMIDRNLDGVDPMDRQGYLKRIEEYDVECSMIKVWCSETLDYVVDEAVQIYGGAGFVEDYPAERRWRDARINRIFEGTNEINRLLVPGRLLRRAIKGDAEGGLPLFQRAAELLQSLSGVEQGGADSQIFLAAEGRMLRGAKQVAVACLGLAAQKFGQAVVEEQEILGDFADIAMETYALESAIVRARKRAADGGVQKAALDEVVVRCFAHDSLDRVAVSARRLLAGVHDGEALSSYLSALDRWTARETVNTIALRREIAIAAIDRGAYPF